jgi:molybdenum cofactor cytidylyltransferase
VTAPPPNVPLILLAAGGSTRLDTPKQLLHFRGRSLLRHAASVALASRCSPVHVVLGSDAPRMREELRGLSVRCVENATWAEGMGGSIRVGVADVLAANPRAAAAVIMLVDQPMVTAAVIDALVSHRQASEHTIVASAYGGSFGPPLLFDAAHFGELCALTGQAGAKAVVQRHLASAAMIPFPDGAIDIDLPADAQRLAREDRPS